MKKYFFLLIFAFIAPVQYAQQSVPVIIVSANQLDLLAVCTANFSFPSSGNCSGQGVLFTDLSFAGATGGYIMSWEWEFGDGTPNVVINFPASPNITHVFAGSASTYQVTLTITTSTACTDAVMKSIIINPSPIANFSFSLAGNCPGQPIAFVDLSMPNGGGSIIIWNWNFGDPASGTSNGSSLQNPVHVYSGPGVYTVSLTVTNAIGCSNTIYQSITIGPIPVPSISGAAATCANSTGNVYATEVGMNSYLWSVSSGGIVTGGGGTGDNSVTVTWNLSGSQTVSVNYTNSSGCSAVSPMVKSIMVYPVPTATITPNGPTTFCQGNSVTLTASVASYYFWSNGETTQSITVTASGSFTVFCTDGNGCSATSAPTVVEVLPLPGIPEIPTGPDTVDLATTISSLYNTAGAPSTSSFAWELNPENAGSISGTLTTGTVTWNPEYLGTARIRVKSLNSCAESLWSDEKLTIVENSMTSIDQNRSKFSVIIYPNPAVNILNIEYQNIPIKNMPVFEFFEIRGQLIRRVSPEPSGMGIDISTLPARLYILKITIGNNYEVVKFVKI